MSEERQTEVVTVVKTREEVRDDVFENLKNSLIAEKHLLGRFIEFSVECAHYQFDESDINTQEAEEALRRANKIRDKMLTKIEAEHLYIFENAETNPITNMISIDIDAREYEFRAVIEVFEDSFDLTVK
ncbi:MAG: hypothetical protein U9Q04_05325 [Campylobacterota bacterium]|nr:hypothetical protein [Campylobacterota bacterium]